MKNLEFIKKRVEAARNIQVKRFDRRKYLLQCRNESKVNKKVLPFRPKCK